MSSEILNKSHNKSLHLTFDKKVVTSVTEDFLMWDDYIEWKAYVKMNDELFKMKLKNEYVL